MTPELYWLTLTLLMTTLFWVSYVLNRMATRGIMGTLGNDAPDLPPLDDWAQRAKLAHQNATENLVLFAPLVIVAHVLELSTGLTVFAASLYFFARLLHFIVQTLGLPVVRTLAFTAGWVAQLIFALTILGIL